MFYVPLILQAAAITFTKHLQAFYTTLNFFSSSLARFFPILAHFRPIFGPFGVGYFRKNETFGMLTLTFGHFEIE